MPETQIIDERSEIMMLIGNASVVACDTEFTFLPEPGESKSAWLNRVDLISVGLVHVASGNTLHCAWTGVESDEFVCSDFVREHVLSVLHSNPVDFWFDSSDQLIERIALFFSENGIQNECASVVVDAEFDGVLAPVFLPAGTGLYVLPSGTHLDFVRGLQRGSLYQHNAVVDAVCLSRVLEQVHKGHFAPGSPVWFLKSMQRCVVVRRWDHDPEMYTVKRLDSGKELAATLSGLCHVNDTKRLRLLGMANSF